MAARAKGTGQAKGRRSPATPKTPATSQATSPTKATAAAAALSADQRPAALRLAAAAQLIEAAGLCVAAALGAISTADGKSSQPASGVALTVFAVAVAVGIALIAAAVDKARPWSRTPTAMIQLFVIIGGIALLDGDRPEWGVPALLLAAVCLAGLLTPASLRALNRPPAKTQ
jgi:peptidoglycan/LPS O-acetylase OafA/YrhL